jgi:thimet oligopeptidase
MKSLSYLFFILSVGLATFGCAKDGDYTEKSLEAVKEPARETPPGDSLIAQPSLPTPESAARLIRSDYKKGELTELCSASIASARARLAEISSIDLKVATFDNTVLAFESTIADLSDATNALTFMKYVSTDKDTQSEGAACEETVGNVFTEIFLDKKMYAVLKSNSPRSASEKRLAEQTLLSFEQNGMSLSDTDLAKLKTLQDQLTKKQADYSNNLNLDKSAIEVTAEQLAGVPQSFIDRLKKTADGKLIVNATEADYPVVMANCSVEQTRHDIMKAYLNRGGDANLKLLADAVEIRQQIAKLVLPAKNADGTDADQTWVTYKVRSRMAKSREIVTGFLDGLKDKLADRNKEDFDQLLAYKKSIDLNATQLNAWDIGYMSNQLKKKNFSVDEEEIRKYFPADVVINGLFSVYSDMLGVTYKDVTADHKMWADGVKLYEIRENDATKRLIGYFYADFYPRPDTGKYGHAAAFSLVSGRLLREGYYSLPVSSIVANLSPPVDGKPALLSHDDVETLFHEFGHIMHQTLTRAPYASLSGSSTAQDFVEAPSQMLENWVWQPEVLTKLSGLQEDHSQHLPKDLLDKMIAARDFQQGYFYTKQLLYGSYDITIHSQQGPVDVNQTYADLHKKLLGLDPIDGQKFPASFGHLMGGYDAGYYGYLWSKVYAQDMFSVFKAEGITNAEVGMRYRKVILEHGNMKDAIDLLPMFLKREPSKAAFYEDLHIKP